MSTSADTMGKKLGMWLFLFTELFLFGGLFVLYAAYFAKYQEGFVKAGAELSLPIGSLNTVILLVSSFLVAASITAVRRATPRVAVGLLSGSLLLGAAFLVNKYFEWGAKFAHGIYPNSEHMASLPHGEIVFYGLYYTVTGLHGLHVIIGMTLLAICLVLILRGRIAPGRDVLLENCGLYWHLVDLIWIFVFPLFYVVV